MKQKTVHEKEIHDEAFCTQCGKRTKHIWEEDYRQWRCDVCGNLHFKGRIRC